MLTMEHVCKWYKIAKRNAGFGEACKAFFHRQYDTIQALDDVNFTINQGEMVGYIGPNGAGKSSTIKILSGILTPESGTVLVDGRIPYKNRIQHVREIGVVFLYPGRTGIYEYFNGWCKRIWEVSHWSLWEKGVIYYNHNDTICIGAILPATVFA